MVGVNNRNLGSFVTNIENSFRIAEELKNAVAEIDFQTPPLLVSESGISHPETIRELRSAFWRKIQMQYSESFGKKIKACIQYVSSSLIAQNKHFISESPEKALTIVSIPCGFFLKLVIIKKSKS